MRRRYVPFNGSTPRHSGSRCRSRPKNRAGEEGAGKYEGEWWIVWFLGSSLRIDIPGSSAEGSAILWRIAPLISADSRAFVDAALPRARRGDVRMLRLLNVFLLRACRLIWRARERAWGATLGIHFAPDVSNALVGERSKGEGGGEEGPRARMCT